MDQAFQLRIALEDGFLNVFEQSSAWGPELCRTLSSDGAPVVVCGLGRFFELKSLAAWWLVGWKKSYLTPRCLHVARSLHVAWSQSSSTGPPVTLPLLRICNVYQWVWWCWDLLNLQYVMYLSACHCILYVMGGSLDVPHQVRFGAQAHRQDLEQRAHETKAFRLGCTHGPPLGITIPEPWCLMPECFEILPRAEHSTVGFKKA